MTALCKQTTNKTYTSNYFTKGQGHNYKTILGYNSDLRYVVRQTYDKVKMS